MNHKKMLLTVVFTFATLLGTQTVSAVTRTVDNDLYECPGAGFTSIQAAVDASSPGDSIRVCPGTYFERVTITTNDLTIFAAISRTATIKPPGIAGPDPYALVLINGAQNVFFNGFVVSGPYPDLPYCSPDLRAGISVIGGGSATIQNNLITQIRSADPDPIIRSCNNGVGIAVGRDLFGHIGSATIIGNVIERYQKNGIFVDGNGSDANIYNNTIRGVPNPVIAQNGIQVSSGATGDVSNNRIDMNNYQGNDSAASGIITFGSGGVRINNNTSDYNDYGIILIFEQNPRVGFNQTNYNDLYGLVVFFTDGAWVERNDSNSNGIDGIFVSNATGNTLIRNRMHFNSSFDAEDDSIGAGTAGTANFWNRNQCRTDNPDGLCTNEPNAGRPNSPILLGGGGGGGGGLFGTFSQEANTFNLGANNGIGANNRDRTVRPSIIR